MKPAAPHVITSWMMRGSSSAETTTIGSRGWRVPELDETIETARSGHRQIEQDEIERTLLVENGARRLDRGGLGNGRIGKCALNDELERFDKEGMVVDDQYA